MDNRRKERRPRPHAHRLARRETASSAEKAGLTEESERPPDIQRNLAAFHAANLHDTNPRTPAAKDAFGKYLFRFRAGAGSAKPLRRMFRELGSDVEALARNKPGRGILPGRWLMECSWPGSTVPAAFPKNVKHPSDLLAPFAGSPLFTPCSKCFRLLLWLLKVRPTRKPDAIKPARRRGEAGKRHIRREERRKRTGRVAVAQTGVLRSPRRTAHI